MVKSFLIIPLALYIVICCWVCNVRQYFFPFLSLFTFVFILSLFFSFPCGVWPVQNRKGTKTEPENNEEVFVDNISYQVFFILAAHLRLPQAIQTCLPLISLI